MDIKLASRCTDKVHRQLRLILYEDVLILFIFLSKDFLHLVSSVHTQGPLFVKLGILELS